MYMIVYILWTCMYVYILWTQILTDMSCMPFKEVQQQAPDDCDESRNNSTKKECQVVSYSTC